MTKTRSESNPSNTPAQPAAGKGVPAKTPLPEKSRPGQHADEHDRTVENSLELPRDRDEASDMTSGKTSPLIEQAGKDIDKGLKDTSKAPELDRAYKKL